MKRRFTDIRIMGNNSGSAMITVLIAVTFTAMIAAILMLSTFTNYSMKVTERQSKQTFYSAESALNEIRTGLQEKVSDAITSAYSEVLINYNESVGNDSAARYSFEQKFINHMKESNFISDNDGETKYLPEMLYSCVSDKDDVTVGGSGEVSMSANNGITFKDVSVTYEKNGYESRVKTDLYIKIPSFSYEASDHLLTSLPEYSVVALEELKNTACGTIDLNGSVFAGKANFDLAGNSINIWSKNFICQDKLSLGTGFEMRTDQTTSLWAKNINVGNSSSISLLGDTYVLDDLTLDGNESEATICGSYFGYGDSVDDASESSSIIVNGRMSSLKFSEDNTSGTGSSGGPGASGSSGLSSNSVVKKLKYLFIAGNSFIDTLSNINGHSSSENSLIRTGESLTVKSAQLAYLIPESLIIGGANPIIYPKNSVPDESALEKVKTNENIWPGTPLSKYVKSEDDVKRIIYSPNNSGQTLVYYYLNFDTQEEADEYFNEYFTMNPSKIQDYLSLYTKMISSVSDVSSVRTKGNALSYDQNVASVTSSVSAPDQVTTLRLKRMFDSLCATLSSSGSGSKLHITEIFDSENMKENMAKLSQGDSVSFKSEGKVTAVVINNEGGEQVSTSDFDNDTCLIITTGDLKVDTDFNGLVLSKGRVTLDSDEINPDSEGVTKALMAENNGVTLMQYLTGTSEDETKKVEDGSWNPKSMVTYKNWEKN